MKTLFVVKMKPAVVGKWAFIVGLVLAGVAVCALAGVAVTATRPATRARASSTRTMIGNLFLI